MFFPCLHYGERKLPAHSHAPHPSVIDVIFHAMIVSANQPYFAPFPGFFAKALLCDVLVLMDTVQFPRGTTWLTRNRFKNDRGGLWLTVPVWKKGRGLQRIDRVHICNEGRWARKHLACLEAAYGHSPFFEEHHRFLKDLFSDPPDRLVDLNVGIIGYLMGCLGIGTTICPLSSLDIDAREPRLSVEVCRKLEASRFLAQSGARMYLDEAMFRDAGIGLCFFRPPRPVYPQLWGHFVPNLSTFDFLFMCGGKARPILERSLGAREGSVSRERSVL